MIINTSSLAALFISYSAAFKQGFKGAKPIQDKIATLVPSTTESNIYPFLGQFPRLREWLGERIIKNLASYDYTVVNKNFEATIAVGKDKISDDVYGVFTPLMAEMGYSAKMHPDELIFALLLLGATELCYDGQPFFDANHPVITAGVAGVVSNYDATGAGNMWALMDCSRPLKPMLYQKRQDYNFVSINKKTDEHVIMKNEYVYGVDGRSNAGFGLWQLAYGSLNTLDNTNFDAAVTAMMSQNSDEDKPLGVRPTHLVCGPSNRAAARALIEVSTLAGGAANPNYKEVDVLVSPHMV